MLLPAVCCLVAGSLGSAGAGTPNAVEGAGFNTKPIAQMAAEYGRSFDLERPPAGQTPEQRIDWVTKKRPMLGRTPAAWLQWARTAFSAVPAAGSESASSASSESASSAFSESGAALAGNVLALYSTMGVPVSPLVAQSLVTKAAAVPESVRGAFSDLVGTVASAYAAQAPLARRVATRFLAGFDPHTPTLRPAERDEMTGRQERIVRAINVFHTRTASAFAALAPLAGRAVKDAPTFADPEGLVILGGTGNGTYAPGGLFGDPVLLVDPSGTDIYTNSAGGACPVTFPNVGAGTWLKCNGLVLSVVADLAGNDTYTYNGVPSAVQGAGGPGGIGILFDAAGSDIYTATMTRGTTAPFEVVTPYFDGGGQGYGYVGAGLLLDGNGNDTYTFNVKSTKGYSIWAFAQGFGGGGGIGIASDVDGIDHWNSYGLGLTGRGFEGVYTDGVGFYGGVGIMTDTGMDGDFYRTSVIADTVDLYAQGFGAFGGLGVLGDDGGSDNYYSLEQAVSLTPTIQLLLNCTYGSASFGAVGVMIDSGGNDSYYGASISTKGAYVMDNGFGGPGVAYGVFLDSGGNDTYKMESTGTPHLIAGRGLYEPGLNGDLLGNPIGENTFGTFVDAGGNDTYIGGPGGNNQTWAFGVDRA